MELREVVIDARTLSTGIGTYTYNTLSGLSRMEARTFRLRAITSAEQAGMIEKLVDRVDIVEHPIYSVGEQFGIAAKVRNADLLHVPHYNVPVMHRGPMVVTIHDLVHITLPEHRRTLKSVVYARPMLWTASRKARQIITGTETAKRELTEVLGICPEKITVIYHGIRPQFHARNRAAARATIQRRFGFSQPYILYVGNLKPHKNVGVLLRGYAHLPASIRGEYRVLIAGGDEYGRQELQALSETLGIETHIILPGFVEDDILPDLYAAAECLVQPSKIEGFGLPVVEAMASDIPVICSMASCLPETGGDASEYFDPDSPQELATVLLKVLDSSDRRSDLRLKARKHIQQFTLEKSAQRHMELYTSILG